MDLKKINQKDIDNMSISEVKDFVRELIYQASNGQPGIQAAILDSDGNSISFTELTEDVGEEKAIEMLALSMKDPDGGSKCISISKEKCLSLMEKISNGEKLTKEEALMLNIINNLTDKCIDKDLIFQERTLISILEEIEDTQETYDCSLLDLMIVNHALILESLKHIDGSKLNMYKDDHNLSLEISERIAKDIMDTWRKSLSEEPDETLVINGLAIALAKTIIDYECKYNKIINLPPVDVIRKNLGIERISLSENESENGSNESDKKDINTAMRNKLKK